MTKTYGLISIDLREKRKKSLFFFSLSLSSRSPSLPFFAFLKMTFSPYFLLFSFPFLFFIFIFIFIFSYFLLFFLVLSFPLFLPLDTWLNVSHSHKCTTCHAIYHPTPDALKNIKFLLSRNPTKFDGITRFCEKNSTVNSVSSSEIYKISGFQSKLSFYHFSEKK